MKIIFKNKMCDVLENHGIREIKGITFKIYTIKQGRKTINVKVDAYNGACYETAI